MSADSERALVPVEGKRLDRQLKAGSVEVKKLEDAPLEVAKAEVGALIGAAIAGKPRKVFGDEGQLSRVVSGEGVPDYFARIYRDPEARRKLGFSFLRGSGVKKRISLVWDEEF
jgi:hypothetical protein